VLALGLLALSPASASAQIYTWRDHAGHLVLSDRPKDPSAVTYAVATAPAVRVTRPAPSRGSTQYDAMIEQHAARQGVRPELVRAVIQAESAFNPNARSVKGAMGLMQLMPATAAQYGVSNPYDPLDNIRAGVTYLRSLLTRYDNKVELALAAYNAGPGAVEKYGRTVPPYRETRSYVDRIRGSLRPGLLVVPFHMYRTVRVVDGREIVKYSNVAAPGAQLVGPASRR
jgi:soluble lytic murein transglycosylase-like protein